MSFTTLKDRQASNRFMLVRMTPARYVGDELIDGGSGVYSMAFSYPVSKVERNGVTLTRVTTVPLVTNDTYYHDEDTTEFLIKLAAPPSATTNVIIISYQLFYTTDSAGTVATQDPEDSNTTKRYWHPRIDNPGRINLSIENIASGVFTISSGSVDVINVDAHFNAYLTAEDSFYQKAIDIWLCIDSVADLEKVYTGTITRISIDKDSVSIAYTDGFSKLKQPCLMGDSPEEAYSQVAVTAVTTKDHHKPIPFVFGKSAHQIGTQSIARFDDTISGIATPYVIAKDGCLKSHYIGGQSDDPDLTSGNNRGYYTIARTSGDFKTLNFGTVSGLVVGESQNDAFGDPVTSGRFYLYRGVQYPYIYFNTTSDHNIEVGDSFKFTHSSALLNSGADQHVLVVGISDDRLTIHGILKSRSFGIAADIILSSTGLVMTPNQAPAICLEHNVQATAGNTPLAFLLYPIDFTYETPTTAAGNKYMRIYLVGGFEIADNLDSVPYHQYLVPTVDPTRDTIYFRVSQDEDFTSHGQVIQSLLESAGIDVDTSSITAADAALVADCAFNVPRAGESDFKDTIEICESVLQSTLGYVTLDQGTGQASYMLLDAPSSSDVDDESIILDSTGVAAEIDYSDLATSIEAVNDYLPNAFYEDAFQSADDAKSLYLNGASVPYVLHHVLQDITGRLADIMAVKARRRATYTFRVATKRLDGDIGDDLQLESSNLLGTLTASDVKIIGIAKSIEDVTIEATPLEGL